jgi:hypothetical protein
MTGEKRVPRVIEPGQEVYIDFFRPGDAEGVVDLFLTVYGEGYPIKTFTSADLLKRENKAGRTISSVARTPKGEIVGHNAIFNSAPYRGIHELGSGAVHPDYRNTARIFMRLNRHGIEEVGKRFGIETIYGESVCNHPYTQKMMDRVGAIDCAIEVDLMPASAYAKERSAPGRVAALLGFITLIRRPHRVYLPEFYEDACRTVYAELDDQREMLISREYLPSGSETRINTEYFPFAQVARLAVDKTGKGFAGVFEKEEEKLILKGTKVIQAWLNLAEPWVGDAAAILREKGYFWGGVLPRWFDTDGLLMQRILHTPHWDGIKTAFDRGRIILDLSRCDWDLGGSPRKSGPCS